MADNKTRETTLSLSAFTDALTDETRRADAIALVKIMQSATGEKPKMWGSSIVGFGSHHYKYASGREGDTPLAAFSPRKAATVLYGVTGFCVSEALLAALGKHSLFARLFNDWFFDTGSARQAWEPRSRSAPRWHAHGSRGG